MLPCGCPTGPAHKITSQDRHDAFHALVVEQGGPAGVVNLETLQAARGFKTLTQAGETILDERARKSGRRASGKLREASR
jgi:hypothetical protein